MVPNRTAQEISIQQDQKTQSLGLADTAFPEVGLSMPEVLSSGEIYRLRRGQYGGYSHSPDYDEGNYIYLKIVDGPVNGRYKCSTFGDDGQHLGPGGGWTKDYEEKPENCHFFRSELELISQASEPKFEMNSEYGMSSFKGSGS